METETKEFKELELKDDFMFSLIMSQKKYCKPFLEIILDMEIEKLEYHQSQTLIEHRDSGKGIRLDVYVKDEKHTVYDLEMQVRADKKKLPKRSRYYQGMIDLSLLERGSDYSSLQKAYVIFVCISDPFGYGLHRYTFENICKEVPELLLGDDAIKVFLNAGGTADDVSEGMKNLLHYIATFEPTDDFTRELDDAVKEARMDERYTLEYIKWQIKAREIEQSGYEIGHSEGIAQGVAQERERSEKLLAEKDGMLVEKDGMLAEKDAIIESLKKQLAALS